MARFRFLSCLLSVLAGVQVAPASGDVLLTGIAGIDAGGEHTCAVTTGSGGKCWGGNGFGQLGNGAPFNALTPIDVTGLTAGVAAITAGSDHTCALTQEGGVKCWGRNYRGQLGNGTTTDALTPIDVTGLGAGAGAAAAAVSAGLWHTCALTNAGGIKCWGWNIYGQLGNGTTIDALTPIDVTGLAVGVAAITAGSYHTCALTSGGGIKCWGYNGYGQLGNGMTIRALTPIDVTGLAVGGAAITAGSDHTCALTQEGGVKCWGRNYYGQLGNGTTTDALTPIDVTGLTAGVAAISAGHSHTCALTNVGGIKCWGANSAGQLGNGTPFNVLTPIDVTGLTAGVTAIAAGLYHSCALTTLGGVKCWGWNSYGQLGNGTTIDALTPVVVLVLDCSGFADLSSANEACPNLEWLKNRAVTLGCAATAYCPSVWTGRLAMAAFLNRMGRPLTPGLISAQASPSALNPDTAPVVCATADLPVTGYPRRATVDGVLAAEATGSVDVVAEPVASLDGGATWQGVVTQAPRGSVPANRWANLHSLGHADLDVGQTVRFGLRVSRAGTPGGATISDSSCNLRVRIDNRNGAASPFDADD